MIYLIQSAVFLRAISPELLLVINAFHSLKELNLTGCSVNGLDLSQLPASLTALTLKKAILDPQSFLSLFSLTHLQYLNLEEIRAVNGLETALIETLHEALPDCRIEI